MVAGTGHPTVDPHAKLIYHRIRRIIIRIRNRRSVDLMWCIAHTWAWAVSIRRRARGRKRWRRASTINLAALPAFIWISIQKITIRLSFFFFCFCFWFFWLIAMRWQIIIIIENIKREKWNSEKDWRFDEGLGGEEGEGSNCKVSAFFFAPF